MADLATLQTWLMEAELALHKLNTGTLEVKVEFNGILTMYNPANADKLRQYIADLKSQISALGGTVTGEKRRGLVVELGGCS